MARLITWNLMTLDGFFEGKEKWNLDFHNKAWGEELEAISEEFDEKAGMLVFGRVTYEGMKAYWTTAEESKIKHFMNGLPKLVASRSLEGSDWNNTRVTADINAEIARLKRESAKDLYIFGSAELCDSLMRDGLVDELMLCVVPVLAGEGTPLFKPGAALDLALEEARPLKNGCVILRYLPQVAA